MVFRWETEAERTPCLVVVQDGEIVFCGAMLQRTIAFEEERNDNELSDDDFVQVFEATLVSFFNVIPS